VMRHSSAMESFSAAASAIAADHQVIDIVASLLLDCAALLPASSTALMVRRDDDRLVLLHSTSHRVAEIEMLQIQSDRGPCVDAISGGVELSETGTRASVARWGDVGEAIVHAGYAHVSAFPLRWHDNVLGGLNVFRAVEQSMAAGDRAVARGFANMATLALVHPSDVPVETVSSRVAEAVSARSVIEQAKGVLAQLHHVDVGTAYELLLARVEADGQTLTGVARQVVEDQFS
jgi:hypothetical protein